MDAEYKYFAEVIKASSKTYLDDYRKKAKILTGNHTKSEQRKVLRMNGQKKEKKLSEARYMQNT